jgi:hypothetical protein
MTILLNLYIKNTKKLLFFLLISDNNQINLIANVIYRERTKCHKKKRNAGIRMNPARL